MISFVFRKLFLFFIPLMVYSQLTLARPTTPLSLNIAVLEMPNYDAPPNLPYRGLQVKANLSTLATAVDDLITQWRNRYGVTSVPDLILLPEFVATGYYVPDNPSGNQPDIWFASEPADYPADCNLPVGTKKEEVHTVEALKALARKYTVALATTYLEQDGSDFYNRFVLVGKDGSLQGPMLRKAKSAATEAYYIKPQPQLAHAFTVPFSIFTNPNGNVIVKEEINIGVGICYENYHCELADYLNTWHENPAFGEKRRIHLLLAPHSAPIDIDFAKVGQNYVDKLNIPIVALANKTRCGTTNSSRDNALFHGKSTIVYKDHTSENVPNSKITIVDRTINNGMVVDSPSERAYCNDQHNTPTTPIPNSGDVRYIFGYNLPITASSDDGTFSPSQVVTLPSGLQYTECRTDALPLWSSMVEDALKNDNGSPYNATVAANYFKNVEFTGAIYYATPQLDKSHNYWRTLNCTNP